MQKGYKTKAVELKRNITELWKDDEDLLCKNQICKFNVQYLGSVAVDDQKAELFYKKAMVSLLHKKKRSGEMRISVYSIVFQDRSTHALILDQTLKKVVLCASYTTVPFSFFYIAEDPTTEICQLYGFISCKEVSDRIVNAVQYAMQIFDEKQRNIPKLEEFSHFPQDESDTTFIQASLAEKHQDPQSSIVIHSTPIKFSRRQPELKSIPRPRGGRSIERKRFGDSFSILSQEEMFKPEEAISKSDEPKMGISINEDLVDIFNERPSSNDTGSDSTVEEKLRRIHRINDAFYKANVQVLGNSFVEPNHTENGSSERSRYESLKNVKSEAALGWSSGLIKSNESTPIPSKSYNAYLDEIIIHDFFHTNPFNSDTQNNFSWKH